MGNNGMSINMKRLIKTAFKNFGYSLNKINLTKEKNEILFKSIYLKYKNYTMIPSTIYIGNLMLIEIAKDIEGAVVECGVWKGGMCAGIAEVLKNSKEYYLFDSFEGLPEAKEIDGKNALMWQSDAQGLYYYDNCTAALSDAETALKMTGVKKFKLVKGWFSETLPKFKAEKGIALLRLDGDWYNSTMDCLKFLFPKVNSGGIIIIDDYYVWEGCTKAVHDYLSYNNRPECIRQSAEGISFIIKS